MTKKTDKGTISGEPLRNLDCIGASIQSGSYKAGKRAQPNGVYTQSGNSKHPVFIAAFPQTDEGMKTVTETHAKRVLRPLEKRGVIDEDDFVDPLQDHSPTLAGITAASVQRMIANGARAGGPYRGPVPRARTGGPYRGPVPGALVGRVL